MSSKNKTNISSGDDYESAICASVQAVHLHDHNILTVAETKILLNLHVDACVEGDQCLVVHDQSRPVNIFGYDPKEGSKHACTVDTTVAYTEPETGQVVFLSIHHTIEVKDLYHHLLCPMQCCMNSQLIDDVPKFLNLFPVNPCMSYCLKTLLMPPIFVKLNRVTSYFNVRKTT